MITQTITLVNKLGLHARAAMKLVNVAGKFQSRIKIEYNSHIVDAKSILNVMVLGATVGKQLNLTFEGEDEQQAADAIITLIKDRFGESE